MKIVKPGVKKAQAFVESCLKKGGYTADTLPPIRALADMAGVSMVTMWKAMRNLRHAGIPAGKKGSESSAVPFPVESTGESAPALQTHTSATKIRQDIERNILSGTYPPDTALPSSKQLQHKYSCSSHTIQKSLKLLCADEIITACGRGYAVPAQAARASSKSIQNKIVLFSHGREDGTLRSGTIGEKLIRALEGFCAQCCIELEIIVFNDTGGRAEFYQYGTGGNCTLTPEKNHLGYIYITAEQPESNDAIFEFLFIAKKPVSVWDINGKWKMPNRYPFQRLLKIFSTSENTYAVREIVTSLLAHKHTRVAYISHNHDSDWSVIRLRNIQSVYEKAGYPEAVVPFTSLQPKPSFLGQSVGRGKLDEFKAFARTWKKSVPAGYRYEANSNFDSTIMQHLRRGETYDCILPLLAAALKHKDITAWIMGNDGMAEHALDFLKLKNVQVPNHLSLVSFDDSDEAFLLGLTSYNFNAPALANAMLGFIQNRSLPSFVSSRARIEIKGNLMMRRSIGLANKGG